MKYIVIGDMHIHPHQGSHQRLQDSAEILLKLCKFAKSKNYTILFVGDLVEKDSYVTKLTCKAIHEALKVGASIKAISGNHDQYGFNYYDSPAYSYLESLNYKNFELIDNTYSIVGDDIVYGIPYYHRPEDFYKALDDISRKVNEDAFNILLIHQTPNGLIDLDIPVQIDLDHELFKKFDYVFMGHIHQEQQLKENVLMVGNSAWIDSTDFGVEKGVFIFDSEDSSLEFIETHYEEAPQTNSVALLKHSQDLETPNEVINDLGSFEGWEENIKSYCEKEAAPEMVEKGLEILKKVF